MSLKYKPSKCAYILNACNEMKTNKTNELQD